MHHYTDLTPEQQAKAIEILEPRHARDVLEKAHIQDPTQQRILLDRFLQLKDFYSNPRLFLEYYAGCTPEEQRTVIKSLTGNEALQLLKSGHIRDADQFDVFRQRVLDSVTTYGQAWLWENRYFLLSRKERKSIWSQMTADQQEAISGSRVLRWLYSWGF